MCALTSCSLTFVKFDITRKKNFTGEIAFFFKNLCFQHPFRCYSNDLITSIIFVRVPVGPLQIVPGYLSHSITWEKKAKFFCQREEKFFWKVWFSTSQVEKTDHIARKLLVKVPLGPLLIDPWHLSCSILREKVDQNLLFTGKIAFFFKNLCFQQPLRSWKHALICSTKNIRRACWPLLLVPWSLSHSIIQRKMCERHLSSWNQLLFEKFVSIDLFGPKELILLLPH